MQYSFPNFKFTTSTADLKHRTCSFKETINLLLHCQNLRYLNLSFSMDKRRFVLTVRSVRQYCHVFGSSSSSDGEFLSVLNVHSHSGYSDSGFNSGSAPPSRLMFPPQRNVVNFTGSVSGISLSLGGAAVAALPPAFDVAPLPPLAYEINRSQLHNE
jgi:hypothetical protein